MKLPKGWKFSDIDGCAEFIGGSQPPQSTFVDEPLPGYVRLLQIRDYKSDRYATYIPEKLSKRWCGIDDIMIGRYGPPIFQILRGKSGSYNVALIKALPKSTVHRDFLFYSLKREDLFQLIDRLSSRTSGQTGIDMDALKAFPLALPPLPEQRKIADILSTWDKALETLDVLIAAKGRQKQALMQQLLSGKTRVKGAKGKWYKKRLDQVFERVERKSPNNPEHILSITAGRGFVDQREKFSRVIAGRNIENYIYLQKGEFSYNKGNSDRYPQGCVYRLEEFEAGAVPNVWISFRIPDESKSNALFYKHFFLSGGLNHELHSRINSGVRNDGLLNLTASNFFTAKVPVPPIEEQESIGILFEFIANELSLLRTQRQTLDQQKRGLMQRLLTGKTRVKP